jgi:hypothetical protein
LTEGLKENERAKIIKKKNLQRFEEIVKRDFEGETVRLFGFAKLADEEGVVTGRTGRKKKKGPTRAKEKKTGAFLFLSSLRVA